MKKDYIRIATIANHYNLSAETLRNWLKAGLVEQTKYKSFCKFHEEDYQIFDRYILEKYNLTKYITNKEV